MRDFRERPQITDSRQQMHRMQFYWSIGIWLILFGTVFAGCVSEPTRNYKKEFVSTYAELTLLYEKEKMVNKHTDSSYQIIVKDFFAKKGLEQEVFKKQIEEISQNEQVWKLFIQDVSAAMDSLKNMK